MTCWTIRKRLPGYLDGTLGISGHEPVRRHLEFCGDCCKEMERYQRLSVLLSRVEASVPPADLGVRIRVEVSRLRAMTPWWHRAYSHASLVARNLLAPLALPATGGTCTAMLAFMLMFQTLMVGLPLGAVPNDIPIGSVQDAKLISLAPFPVHSRGAQTATTHGDNLLLVEVIVNERGEAVGYEILYGPDGQDVRRQLDQVLLFSRFQPRFTFGRPTRGGRVRMVLNFSEIRVRG